MSSSTFSFERSTPAIRWGQTAFLAAVLLALAVVAWEIRCRLSGYAPTVNDTLDLWSSRRASVRADSIVIIGDSRAWFDLDLDELEKALGKRPVQLALSGSCVYPVLENLSQDETFRGTIICSVVPALFFAPSGPPLKRSDEAVAHYRKQTFSEKLDLPLAMALEQRLAFMNKQELTLGAMLKTLPIPDRSGVQHGPEHPPYMCSMDTERRARMIERCARPGPLQSKVQSVWIPLFTPPPPPPGVSNEEYDAQFRKAFEQRLKDTSVAVEKIRSRGGHVVFLRFPSSGPLKELEDRLTPRQQTWDVLLQRTGAPGIHYADHPELNEFQCPEWSHLNVADSVEYTHRLAPYLKAILIEFELQRGKEPRQSALNAESRCLLTTSGSTPLRFVAADK